MSIPIYKDAAGRIAQVASTDSIEVAGVQPRTATTPVAVGDTGGVRVDGPIAPAASAGSGRSIAIRAGNTTNSAVNGGTLTLDAGTSPVSANNGQVIIGQASSEVRVGDVGTPIYLGGPVEVNGSAGSILTVIDTTPTTFFEMDTTAGTPLLRCTPTLIGTTTAHLPLAAYQDPGGSITEMKLFAAAGNPNGEISAEAGSICHVANPNTPAESGLWIKSYGTADTGWEQTLIADYINIPIENGQVINTGDAVAASSVSGRCRAADAAGGAYPIFLGMAVVGGTGNVAGTVFARIQTCGAYRGASGLTAPGQVYLSTSTPGAVTTSVPTGSGNVLLRVGMVYSATAFVISVGPLVTL